MLLPFSSILTFSLCCHLLCLPAVPNSAHNGFEGTIQRSHRPSYEEKVCFVATVRLATPQFIKVRTNEITFISFLNGL